MRSRVMHLARETQARGEQVDAQLVAAGTAPLRTRCASPSSRSVRAHHSRALFAATGVRERAFARRAHHRRARAQVRGLFRERALRRRPTAPHGRVRASARRAVRADAHAFGRVAAEARRAPAALARAGRERARRESGGSAESHPGDRAIALLIAIALAILGFLPIANWLPGGEVDNAYAHRYIEWGYGTAICLGVAIIAAVFWGVAARRRRSSSARAPSARASAVRSRDATDSARRARAVRGHRARCVFRTAAADRRSRPAVSGAHLCRGPSLAARVAPHREFFSILHVVDTGDKVYSQFPPGGPAMLALGELVHAPWLVGPVCGAISVALFARLVKLTDPDASRRFHVGATLLVRRRTVRRVHVRIAHEPCDDADVAAGRDAWSRRGRASAARRALAGRS